MFTNESWNLDTRMRNTLYELGWGPSLASNGKCFIIRWTKNCFDNTYACEPSLRDWMRPVSGIQKGNGLFIGWGPCLASKWTNGVLLIDSFFPECGPCLALEVVAPLTTLCIMGVSWPSRRGSGNDGLERIFGRPTDVLSSPIEIDIGYLIVDTWYLVLDTWNMTLGYLDTWTHGYLTHDMWSWNMIMT